VVSVGRYRCEIHGAPRNTQNLNLREWRFVLEEVKNGTLREVEIRTPVSAGEKGVAKMVAI